MATPKIQQMTCSRVKFKHYVYELEKKKNRIKSSVRAKVEHPLRMLKPVFGFDIAKNHHRLCANFVCGESLYVPQMSGSAGVDVCPEAEK